MFLVEARTIRLPLASPRFARASLGLRVNGRIANIYSVHASLRLSLALLGQVSGSESKSQSLNHIERTKQALKH